MTEMKIEWAASISIGDRLRADDIPVVHLPEVDTIIAEAVWAMEIVEFNSMPHTADYKRTASFLDSNTVAQWRERQEQKS